jgi:hypothetical protein
MKKGTTGKGDNRSIDPHDKTLVATAGSHWLRITAPARPISRSLHFYGGQDKATGVPLAGKLIEVFSGQGAEQVAHDRGNCHGNELGIDWVIDGAPYLHYQRRLELPNQSLGSATLMHAHHYK